VVKVMGDDFVVAHDLCLLRTGPVFLVKSDQAHSCADSDCTAVFRV